MLVTPLTPWIVNDTVICKVDTLVSGVGNMSISIGKAVLSGHGASETFLTANVKKGDTIKIYLGISPSIKRLTQMLGGFPKIVYNGTDYVDQGFQEEGGPSHTYERHPRTGVGFSADSSKFYLIVVDGRQPALSAGMTLHELAEFMLFLGIHHGINFDGGGSTTMVVQGNIVNSPSDAAGERSVANALIVVSSAPSTGKVNSIQMKTKRIKVFAGDTYAFAVSGMDEYGNPASLDTSKIRYSVPSRLGTVSNLGLFIAGQKRDSGYVLVNYDNLRDSTFVVITTINKVSIYPKNVVTDTIRKITFGINAYDQDNVQRLYTPKHLFQT